MAETIAQSVIERKRAAVRKWRATHRETDRENSRRWRALNPEKQREQHKEKRRKQPEKYRLLGLKRTQRWQAKNIGYVNAQTSKRKAARIKRTPVWADLAAIQKFYDQAAVLTATTGETWHVDHIIPLQGKLVSGLHVAENLQLLLGKENCRKGNAFTP